jgi:hypothetical protein
MAKREKKRKEERRAEQNRGERREKRGERREERGERREKREKRRGKRERTSILPVCLEPMQALSRKTRTTHWCGEETIPNVDNVDIWE